MRAPHSTTSWPRRLITTVPALVLLVCMLWTAPAASAQPRQQNDSPGAWLQHRDESITPNANPGDENWANDPFPLLGTDDTIYALAVDADRYVYAGGEFAVAGGMRANHVARWDGTAWSALGGGMNGDVHALVVDAAGNLYAGGEFTTADGVDANHVAKWDGNTWAALGDGVLGCDSNSLCVSALAIDAAGNLYAGGTFTAAGGVHANNVAQWNGSTWSVLGRGVNAGVRALAVDAAGNLYAGGGFSAAGGVSTNAIAKWDGTAWSALGSGMGGYDAYVSALTMDVTGNLYAGGRFTTAGSVEVNSVARWDGEIWSPLGSGMADGSNTVVQALASDGGDNLYAGGWYTEAGGVRAWHIAEWNGSTWSPLGSGMMRTCTQTGRCIEALAVDTTGNLYAGGYFTVAGDVNANRIARWDDTAWAPVGGGMNGDVLALAVDRAGRVYAGGRFTTAGPEGTRHIATRDGTTWTSLGSGMGGGYEPWVGALVFDASGHLYAGGRFITAGGVSVNYVAKWDGTTWSALGSGTNGPVRALVFDAAGNLYAGGEFTTAGGVSADYIAKWDGSAWSPLGGGVSGAQYLYVRSLACDAVGNLYAGGGFITAGGVIANYVAKWDGATWSALGSGMNGAVHALVFDAAGSLYAGGEFTTAGGVSARRIAKWNGTTWSSLSSAIPDAVHALAFDAAANLYVGGDFIPVGGSSANHIATWDGTIWSPVGSGVSGSAHALAADSTGNLYVGGDFVTAGNHASAYIARWTAADGVRGVTTGSYTFYTSNLPVTITVTTPGTLDQLAVQRFNRSHPQSSAGLDTGYYWEITGRTATGSPASGYVVDLTLPTTFRPATGDQVCRFANGAWDCAVSAYTPNAITRAGITELSDWAVAHYRNTWYLPLVPRGR